MPPVLLTQADMADYSSSKVKGATVLPIKMGLT